VRILFVHCNFPAQFRHLSRHFAEAGGHEVKFLAQSKEWTAEDHPLISLHRYQLGRDPQGQLCHPYLRRYETAMLHGQAALREALRLSEQGFQPDLIIGHSGFGNTLFLKEVWPKARFIGYFEWFTAPGAPMWALAASPKPPALIHPCGSTPTTARS